ncbi:phenylacetic acid degradation protein [Sulfolobus sp. A20]|uniref:metal-sulfur cluster assembly factor n=1 Tax=Sulfolobaceae TaxID=118883 RepID=UPI000845F1D6|nr:MULTISPECIES: metal-sulfur cluster assembly factor [unclassified Sulfolobus]TRM76473.1 metal-sulfur cluster assembly factor [Sulfolobus sp. E5]TRM76714.1 metal-sulfur cluster assembly factor [Sulfolobus sp. A20-N-F8]TRM76905.1 metal-sulfur cluster assembly factor [Sulfolobus sp. B5]TRM82765.1 metal-sulfur cluster assembly factor [Sulfolobus sp. A20-N-F6]TRM84562.1 metal-sulfur cluster assembly factor [Sulfolobus sp. F3]TRM87758.1 metal-sulfur cluster assembly factor [Sulfolobus sp. C3]TRM
MSTKQQDVNKEEWKKKIIDALKDVYDPEIPVDIVNLGLIYDLKISDDGDIYLRLGLTAPGCPVIDDLIYTVEQVIKETVPAKSVEVDIDLDTQWTPLKMTPEGREKFKQLYGYDIVEMWVQTYGLPADEQKS